MIYECYNLAEVKYMSKIDIISGFLGAGKTTLIKKLIAEAYQNEKIVLISVIFFVFLLFIFYLLLFIF